MTAPRLPDLSAVIVTALNTTFSGTFTAVHSGNVVYKLSDLSTIKVNVWPAGLSRARAVRACWSRTGNVIIAIQKRATDQTAIDTLTNLADDVLDSCLGARFDSNKWICTAGEFTDEVYDRLERYEENVFQSLISLTLEVLS